jgi:Protein of unknown function with HXXEE motif
MLLAYALHILEEHALDWLDWANTTFGTNFTWADFYVTNSVVVVAGISTAVIGWRLPEASLAFPALALINAVFFHIDPTLVRRVFSPGVLTAVLLFLPVGIWSYYGAYLDGVLTLRAGVFYAFLVAIFITYPLALVGIKRRLLH